MDDGAGDKVAMKRPAAHVQYFYGWDAEHSVAWRRPVDGKGVQEVTKDLFCDAAANDMSPMWARWPDGDEHMIADLLKATYDTIEKTTKGMVIRGRGSGKEAAVRIWEGAHVQTGKTVTVTRRQDRRPLTIIREDKLQIMQVTAIQVANDMEKADLVATEVAQEFAAGKVDKDGLKDLRNKVLEKHGFKSTAEGEKEQAGKTRPPMKKRQQKCGGEDSQKGSEKEPKQGKVKAEPKAKAHTSKPNQGKANAGTKATPGKVKETGRKRPSAAEPTEEKKKKSTTVAPVKTNADEDWSDFENGPPLSDDDLWTACPPAAS